MDKLTKALNIANLVVQILMVVILCVVRFTLNYEDFMATAMLILAVNSMVLMSKGA